MSKKVQNIGLLPSPSFMLPQYMADMIVGKVLTIIDSINLPDKQDKAVKDLIRNEIYGAINGQDSTYITSSLTGEIYRCVSEIKASNPDPTAPQKEVEYSLSWKPVN